VAQTVFLRFFNQLMATISIDILHIHKDRRDSLNLDEIVNDFIDRKETRVTQFT